MCIVFSSISRRPTSTTVHAFEAESLAGSGCGAHNASGMLWTYTIFGANTEDYVSGDEHMKVPDKSNNKPGGIEGHTVGDLIGEDVAVAWNGLDGTVTGTLKNISTPWTQFDTKNSTGHFFPITLDKQYEGKDITVNLSGGTKKTAADLEWVIRVDDYVSAQTPAVFECEGKVILTLDFSKATLPA